MQVGALVSPSLTLTRPQPQHPPGPRRAGAGGRLAWAGDLYLRVRVQTDLVFEREGKDLRVSVPVDLYTAVLGGEVRVPTLNGPVVLTIPEDTQNGRVFRLRSKGMPRLRDPKQHGDLYARGDVQLPTNLTPRQRELFEELRRGLVGEPHKRCAERSRACHSLGGCWRDSRRADQIRSTLAPNSEMRWRSPSSWRKALSIRSSSPCTKRV